MLRRNSGLYLILTALLLAGMLVPNLPEAATGAPQAIADDDCEGASLPGRFDVHVAPCSESAVPLAPHVDHQIHAIPAPATGGNHGRLPPVRAPPSNQHLR